MAQAEAATSVLAGLMECLQAAKHGDGSIAVIMVSSYLVSVEGLLAQMLLAR
jgi:hypothetical protein